MNEGIYVYENSWFSECKFFPHLQQNNLESRQRIIVLAVNKCKNVNIIFNVLLPLPANIDKVLINITLQTITIQVKYLTIFILFLLLFCKLKILKILYRLLLFRL